ncbi:hypothetical protein N0M98_03145 [Paenibacillus doosanensis]|uniref:DUF6916 domain-containing protein n=1 Tax=Paenibacillus konkukensis TaxID=2020716 RepID=A0ABY4RR52_9BACL|nr:MULTISPECIES: hypothetical protein [Paenibacillus]MCS7459127.1 hypothetical protein [Paenibacillus doosanensis]UQZ84184.1 hypothetical protein SK3146_03417 [Paenibacillus konkukensis]
MLSKDSLADFQSVLYSRFQAESDSGPVELKLTEVEVKQASPQAEQFSLLLKGPEAPFLPQQMYRMNHEQLGELDLFMVPVGKGKDGFLYEIVFNRLVTG